MNSKRLRLITGAVVFLLIGVLIAGWLMKGNSKPSTRIPRPKSPIDDNVLMGMTIKVPGTEKDSYWELKVDRFSGLDHIGRMKTIKGDFFVSGKPIYHVAARAGEVNWDNRQIRFVDQVVFTSNDGKKLSAKQFLWDPKANKVFAEQQVVLTAPGLAVTTTKLEADPQLNQVGFTGETKVLYQQDNRLKLGGDDRPRGER